MPEPTIKSLENDLAVSERNRFTLKLETVEAGVEEAAFLWGLADLMTILLIFFILLYSMANHSAVTARAEIVKIEDFPVKNEQGVEKRKIPVSEIMPDVATIQPQDTLRRETDPLIQENSTGELTKDEPASAWDQINFKLFEDITSADFYIRWDEQRPIFVLGERITFKAGKAELLETFQTALRPLTDLIASVPEYQVVVSGHTDNTPISTSQFPSNWELSAARAVSVAKFLIAGGVAAGRITIQGQAEYMPLFANSTAENRQANRRVEITLVKASEKK